MIDVGGTTYAVRYDPGDSTSGLFGGNSNWRGPIWFPINYLLIESLQKFHHYYGDEFLVECPTGSGKMMTLGAIADDLSRRLTHLFLPDADGHRPALGAHPTHARRPALARLSALLRVFPRRYGRGRRRKPPDRLDGARRQTARTNGMRPCTGGPVMNIKHWVTVGADFSLRQSRHAEAATTRNQVIIAMQSITLNLCDTYRCRLLVSIV